MVRRSVEICVVIAWSLVLLAAPASALDIIIDSASFTTSHPLHYFVGSDTVLVDFTVDASVEDGEPAPNVDILVEAVAYDSLGIPISPESVFRVGVATIPDQNIAFRNPASPAPSGPAMFQVKLSGVSDGGASFETWRMKQMIAGNQFRFRLLADPNDLIAEDPAATAENNNHFRIPTDAHSYPLTGTLEFGAVETQITSIAADPLACPVGEVEITSVSFLWDPASNSSWNQIALVSAPLILCNPIVADFANDGFDIRALFSVPVPTVTGTMGGLASVASGLNLTPTNVQLGTLALELPQGHSYHLAELTSPSHPHPRGTDWLLGLIPDQAFVADLADMTASVLGGFLQARSLPFTLALDRLNIAGAAVTGSFLRARYAYDLPFSPADPRPINMKSNDRRYQFPDAPSGLGNGFALDVNGLSASVPFNSGFATLHFPFASLIYADFEAVIEDGALQDGQTFPVGDSYFIKQRTPCPGCDAATLNAKRAFGVTTSTAQGVGSDGTVMARFTLLSASAVTPGWGPKPPDLVVPSDTTTFERIGDDTHPGMVMLPGFHAEGTDGFNAPSVPEYLMGMRSATDSGGTPLPATHYFLNSAASRLGNHFMAGITMGPELYSVGALHQPSVGTLGDDLSLTETSIALPSGTPGFSIFQNIVANLGTKYVIRHGGITGVFNTSIVPNPQIYGYDFDFRRWAFRLVSNELDETTWLDGTVSVPKPGLFDISFSSLGLLCTGALGGGNVDKEACDGEDNNGNGVQDENCNETLHAWKTVFDILTMGFAPTNPPANVCFVDERQMEVGSVVHPQAMDEPLGLIAQWSNQGDPSKEQITGSSYRTIDRPVSPSTSADNVGFSMVIDSQPSLPTATEDEGWFEFTGKLGLPFWEAMPVRARLQNQTTSAQLQTIFVEESQAVPGIHAAALAIMNNLVSSRPSPTYTWGNTGYSIDPGDLPLRYQNGNHPNKRPRFLGETNPALDIVVMDSQAAADFVTPSETKLSFGASADTNLSIEIHVDVSNSDGVAEVDGVLNGLGVPGTPVKNLIDQPANSIIGAMGDMNRVLDAGLHAFLREAVEDAIPINSKVTAFATSLAQLTAIPAEAAVAVTTGLNEALGVLPAPLNDDLEAAVTSIWNDLPELFNEDNPDFPDMERLDALEIRLENVDLALGGFQAEVQAAADAVVNAETNLDMMLGTAVSEWLPNFDAARTDLRIFLGTTGLGFCFGNPLFGQIENARDTIRELRLGLSAVNISAFGNVISYVSSVNLDGVAGAQHDALLAAEEVEERLQDAEFAMVPLLCGSGSVLGDLTGAGGLLDLTADIATLTNALGNLKLNAPVDFDVVSFELGVAAKSVGDARKFVGALLAAVDIIQQNDPLLDFKYKANAPIEIPALMNAEFDMMTTGYSFFYPNTNHSFITEFNLKLLDPVDQAISTTAGSISAALAPLSAFPGQSTPARVRRLLVDTVMNEPGVEAASVVFHDHVSEIALDLNTATLFLFDQLNYLLRQAFANLEGPIEAALEAASSNVSNWAMGAGRMDGFALITGEELERIHVEAKWAVDGDTDDQDTSYGGSLDVTSWNANGKAEGCMVPAADELLDAIISVQNVPIQIGPSELMIKELYMGFTLRANPDPTIEGLFGGIVTEGKIGAGQIYIFDPQLHTGVGSIEGYIGARAGARFNSFQLVVAFLIGKTCNNDILLSLDAQAAEFIGPLPSGFNGVFVRGSASMPIFSAGCLFEISAWVDVGVWVVVGPPTVVGGLVGGALYGEGACLVSVRGQLTTFLQAEGELLDPEKVKFQGEGFAVGGFGFDCDPDTWTSVSRSRDDDWCGTGDANFKASYDGDGFSISNPKISVLY